MLRRFMVKPSTEDCPSLHSRAALASLSMAPSFMAIPALVLSAANNSQLVPRYGSGYERARRICRRRL